MTAALTAVAKAAMGKMQEIAIPFDCELNRSYGDFKEELGTLGKLHIDLFGETYDESTLETRGSVRHRVTIAIAVRKRFDIADQSDADAGKPRIKAEEIDDLVGLTQTLHDFWLDEDNRRLVDDEYGLTWQETNIVHNPNRKMLLENHQFMGLIRLTYDAVKEL